MIQDALRSTVSGALENQYDETSLAPHGYSFRPPLRFGGTTIRKEVRRFAFQQTAFDARSWSAGPAE